MSDQSAMFDGDEVFDDDVWASQPTELPEEPEHLQDEKPNEKPSQHPYHYQCMDDLETEDVIWLWNKRIPMNLLTLIEGHPSAGKSTVLVDLVARLTTGQPLPGDDVAHQAMNVLWVTMEDSPRQTLRPRFLAAGGDPKRLWVQDEIDVLGGNNVKDAERKQRWARLQAVIDAVQPKVIVIDPGSATVEDSNSEAIVRQVMGKMFRMGQDLGITTLWIRHLVKVGADREDWAAGLGSVGFTAAARSQLQIHTDFKGKDEGESYPRILQQVKSNLGPIADTLEFGIRGIDVTDPKNGKTVFTSQVYWGGTTEKSAATLRAKNASSKRDSVKAKDARVAKLERWGQKEGTFTAEQAVDFLGDDVNLRTVRRDLAAAGFVQFGSTGVWSLPSEAEGQES